MIAIMGDRKRKSKELPKEEHACSNDDDNQSQLNKKRKRKAEFMKKCRQDKNYRAKERERDARKIKEKREDEEYRAKERERDSRQIKEKRKDGEYRDKERERTAMQIKEKRKDEEYRAKERERDARKIKEKREDEEYRAKERERDSRQIKKKRKDGEYRDKERERTAMQIKEKREDEEYRAKERERDARKIKEKREDEEYRAKERERDSRQIKEKRKDGEYRDKERERTAMQIKEKREDEEYRAKERERDARKIKEKREDKEYRDKERERTAMQMKVKRNETDYREKEREKGAFQKRQRRDDEEFRAKERDRTAMQMKDKRREKDYREKETERRVTQMRDKMEHEETKIHSFRERMKIRRQEIKKSDNLRNSAWSKLIQQYESAIKDGPRHLCSSCGGLWFAKSMHRVTEKFLKSLKAEFQKSLLRKQLPSGEFQLCGTCHNSAYQGKIPKRNLSNGFGFPQLPPTLTELTQLEERLVSPRLPFMQIRALGADQQKALLGNIVNVPNDLDICSKVLPRSFDDISIMEVQLMRKMEYKTPYLHETIRPKMVYDAAKYLCSSELYSQEGVVLCNDWERNFTITTKIVSDIDECTNQSDSELMDCDENEADENREELVSEDEDEELIGADETLILTNDNRMVKIAPGQGQRPIGILRDTNAEQLSFPTIYGGIPRRFKDGIKITLTDIAISETRMFDPRGRRPDKLLYLAKLLQNRNVADQINICLRKKKGLKFTAGDIRKEGKLDSIISHDDGFKFLKGIRNSTAYWQAEQKRVLAMIRQVSLPTFFVTLSAAESHWPELLVNLESIINGNTIDEEQAMQMTYQQKSNLIRADPVTCALYFDHRFRSLLNTLINKPAGIFNPYKVTDHYAKTEFQHRGSPHQHMLLWMEGAPTYSNEDMDGQVRCIQFINEFISCSRTGDEELEKYIGYQLHKHTHTCKQKTSNGFKCRFNLPLPPLPETMILTPIHKDDPEFEKATSNFLKLKMKLNDMGRNFRDEIPFVQFLSELELSHLEYIKAIRSSIKRDKIFLKRRTCDIFVNAYNDKTLKAWKANMDIQFILDPYACVKYCVSYLTKSTGGMSKLMRDVEADIRKGNQTLAEKTRTIANKFINAVEISAQEAAYLVLGLNLTNCSRDNVFINTGPPEERVQVLKPMEELNCLPEDSTDIIINGILHQYCQRPEEMETICLAQFASQFSFCSTSSNKKALQLLDGSGFIIPRRKSKIIRFRRYNQLQDPANYYREQLMLFNPWRSEDKELQQVNPELKFRFCNTTVCSNRFHFDPNHGANSIEDLVEKLEPDLLEDWISESVKRDSDFDTDILDSMGNSKQVRKFEFLMAPKQIDNTEYWSMYRNLNRNQRKYFMHLVHSIRRCRKDNYEFISGGAGASKSHLITLTVQWLLRHQSQQFGIDLESMPVLVAAPTGKAAFNIFGITLHCAFRLPPNERTYGTLAPLADDICNSLRLKYMNLKLLIIDEISMVSLTKFCEINSRLQQIFQNNSLFGGIAVMVVGDFYQIRPVMGKFVFEVDRRTPFGSITGNILWSPFKMYELTEVMRQQGALQFAVALNNLALGCMTTQDIALIRSREISTKLVPPPDALHLFHENKDCATYNQQHHETLGTEWAISNAFDKVQGATSAQQELSFLEFIQTKSTSETDGLPRSVRLQIGAQYMISTNINVPDGLFNGSTGELMQIDYGRNADENRIPATIYMRFDNPIVGSETRRKYEVSQFGVRKNWTPIVAVTKPLNKIGYTQGLTVTRRQIPVVPANAITITKAQGSSRKCIVVHIPRRLRRDLIYVAMSRTFTLEGLFIDGTFQAPGLPPQYLVNEMTRLRQNPLELSIRFLQDTPIGCYRLMFHNIQSLHAHYLDVICDEQYMGSHILAFVEPHTLGRDDYYFSNFPRIERQDCQGIRSSYGTFLAANLELHNYSFTHCKSNISSHWSFTTWSCDKVLMTMVYRSPDSSVRSFMLHLEDWLKSIADNFLIIFGDFNIDIRKDRNIIILFQRFGMKLTVPENTVSTIGGTQIDLCFSNITECKSWYCESIFSYHSSIAVIWPNDSKVFTKTQVDDLQHSMEGLGLNDTLPNQNKTESTNQEVEMDIDISETESPNQDLGAERPIKDIEEGLEKVWGNIEATDRERESEQTELKEQDGTILPRVTTQNAGDTYWFVQGVSLCLIDLKSLNNQLDATESRVLAEIAVQNREVRRESEFHHNYVTDNTLDACIRSFAAGTSSILVSPGTVELTLHNKDYLFGADPTEWCSSEQIFIPVHYLAHWTLIIVQPAKKTCLVLDPAVPYHHRMPHHIRQLLDNITEIMEIQFVQQPAKCHQRDEFNCGIFVIKYVENYINNQPLIGGFDPTEYRLSLLQRLWLNSDKYILTL